MNEREMLDGLREVFLALESQEQADELNFPSPVARVDTFEDVGLLTRDKGLVVVLEDESEFQITIVRSAEGRGDDDDEDDSEEDVDEEEDDDSEDGICQKCGQAFAAHNDDGSCVED